MSRRALLVGGATLLGAAVPVCGLFGRSSTGNAGRYGPLQPDPGGVLALPKGFSYRILARAGDPMSDGYRVPWSFDGMACFPGPDGTLILMRNHENTWFPPLGPYMPGTSAPPEAYDPHAQGGVTRQVIRADSLDAVSSNLVLTGTVRNCAGGMSPWGWLSCEETSEERHGYVFLCSTGAARVAPPRRLDGYGRFRHEAACVDPTTLVAYLTEDQEDGCLYRFVPRSPSQPFEGRLQALAVAGRPGLDTGRGLTVGADFGVTWVDIDDPGATFRTVRAQGLARGAAVVRRGEGMWFDQGRVFVCSTSGGPRGAGQVFRLSVGARGQTDRFTLVAQSADTRVLDMPDNLTVAPWGDVILAEDAIGGDQYLRVLQRNGTLLDLARNEKSQSELAGVCFSPDGDTLFVNVYADGLTLAIRGPFRA